MYSDEEYGEAMEEDIFIGVVTGQVGAGGSGTTNALNAGGAQGGGAGKARQAPPRDPNVNLNISNQAYLVPKYTGTGDPSLESYIEAMEITKVLSGWTPEQMLSVSKLRLGGPASDLIRANAATLTTWERIKKALRSRFKPRIPRHILEQKLTSCSQKKGENVSEFATRLRLIGRQITESLLEEPTVRNIAAAEAIDERLFLHFVNNVRRDIKRFVLVQKPVDLQMALDAAIIEEALLEIPSRFEEGESTVAALQEDSYINAMHPTAGHAQHDTSRNPSDERDMRRTGYVQYQGPSSDSRYRPEPRYPYHNNGYFYTTQDSRPSYRGGYNAAGYSKRPGYNYPATNNSSSRNNMPFQGNRQNQQFTSWQGNSRYQTSSQHRGGDRPRQDNPNQVSRQSYNNNSQPANQPSQHGTGNRLICYNCLSTQHSSKGCPLVKCGHCGSSTHKPYQCPTKTKN